MRKINLTWTDSDDAFLLDITTGRVISVSSEKSFINDKIDVYYTSSRIKQASLTTNRYILLGTDNGSYNSDIKKIDDCEIYVVPLSKHFPNIPNKVVVTFENSIIVFTLNEDKKLPGMFFDVVSHANNFYINKVNNLVANGYLQYKNIKFNFYDKYSTSMPIEINCYGDYKGLDILKYWQSDFLKSEGDFIKSNSQGLYWDHNIYYNESNDSYYHVNRKGYIDSVSRCIDSAMKAAGFSIYQVHEQYEPLYYKLNIDNTFETITRAKGHVRYNNQDEWFDWESNYDFMLLEDIAVEHRKMILRKIKEDYVQKQKNKLASIDIKNIFQKLIDKGEFLQPISLSFDAGNCIPGTESFVNRFNFKKIGKDYIDIRSIVNHKDYEEICQNNDFKKVIFNSFCDNKELNINKEENDEL